MKSCFWYSTYRHRTRLLNRASSYALRAMNAQGNVERQARNSRPPAIASCRGTKRYTKLLQGRGSIFYCAVKILTNCTIWLTCAVLMHKAQSTVVAASFNFGVAGSNPTPGISKGPTSSVQRVGTRWRRGSKEVSFGKIKIPCYEAKRYSRREKETK